MKIEIKNLKHSPSLSEETNAYTADILIEGIKAGAAKNNGHGGETSIYSYPGKEKLIAIAEDYLKKQPQVDLGNGVLITLNLEFFVDDLVDKAIQEKEIKRYTANLKRMMTKQIIIVNKQEYEDFIQGKRQDLTMDTMKFIIPLSQVPESTLHTGLAKIKARLKPGEMILNTGPNFDSFK